MAYALLITGILFIAYGLTGFKKEGNFVEDRGDNQAAAPTGQFESMLQSSEILRRLKIIDEKIDALSGSIDIQDSGVNNNEMIEELVMSHRTQLNISPEDVNDINRRIIRLKNDGMDIEQIANELGLMKGEVLLRLGMKK